MRLSHSFRAVAANIWAHLLIAVQYRGAVVITIFGNLIGLHITYSLWNTLYSLQNSVGGLSRSSALSHVLLGQVFIAFLTQGLENIVGQQVRTGGIAFEMSRPVDYQTLLMGQTIGRTLGVCLTRALPVYIFSLTFYQLRFPAPGNVVPVVVSLLISFGINFCVSFLFSVVSFWTLNTWGLMSARILCVSFLSGALVPTSLFPHWLSTLVNYLPFRSAAEIPILLYLGEGNTLVLLRGQVLWLVVIAGTSRLVYLSLRRRVLVQGG